MYHGISESSPRGPQPNVGFSLVVSPKSFVKQIDWLEKKKFRFLSLDEVVDQKGKIPLWSRSVALTFDDGFRDNYEKAFPALLARQKSAALFVVVNWVGSNGFVGWKEIRELADSGVTIGSHSLSHRWLPKITNPEELVREVSDSKKIIEDQIGREVKHFSYPVGGLDERVVEQVQKAGYKAGWVASAGPTVNIKNPIYCLRRIKVSDADKSLTRFAIKAYGLKSLLRKPGNNKILL